MQVPQPLQQLHDLAPAVMLSMAAGLCSAVGAVIAVFLAGNDMPLQRLACWQAALGAALLFLGCCDLLPEAAAGISLLRTAVFFALGALGSATTAKCLRIRAMDVFALHAAGGEDAVPGEVGAASSAGREEGGALQEDRERQRGILRGEVLAVGLVTFVSLSVHNLLEGMSILFAVQEGFESGVRLAAAISLENVPEGVCIALPLYFATRRKLIGIRLALFSGMLEPLGVLLPGLFIRNYMTQTSISSVLAIIAGILVFVALAEMLPLAVKTAGTNTMASLSVWMGCGVMSATLLQPLLMYHARIGRVE